MSWSSQERRVSGRVHGRKARKARTVRSTETHERRGRHERARGQEEGVIAKQLTVARKSEARVKTGCRRDERGEIPGEAKAQERNERWEPDNTGLTQRTWLVQQSSGPQLVET